MPDNLEDMTFEQLINERAELLGNKASLEELTEEQLERFVSLNAKIRMTARTAGKPAKAKPTAQSLESLVDV